MARGGFAVSGRKVAMVGHLLDGLLLHDLPINGVRAPAALGCNRVPFAKLANHVICLYTDCRNDRKLWLRADRRLKFALPQMNVSSGPVLRLDHSTRSALLVEALSGYLARLEGVCQRGGCGSPSLLRLPEQWHRVRAVVRLNGGRMVPKCPALMRHEDCEFAAVRGEPNNRANGLGELDPSRGYEIGHVLHLRCTKDARKPDGAPQLVDWLA